MLSTHSVMPGVPSYATPQPDDAMTSMWVGVASGLSQPTSLTGTISPLEFWRNSFAKRV